MKTKVIDTREYVRTLAELSGRGEEVCMPVAGGSMTPFLVHERDAVCFSKPKAPLKKGDIVFYQRKSGQYVMHRICRTGEEGYYMVGDAQWQIEGPLQEACIFAVITKVRRKGRWIGKKNFWWWFFAHIWIRIIPARRTVMRIYHCVRKWIKE